jgi:hypothetical protein
MRGFDHSSEKRLYEHFGDEVVGPARLSPELETWGLFLTTRGRQVPYLEAAVSFDVYFAGSASKDALHSFEQK